jgi:hypothetical protein
MVPLRGATIQLLTELLHLLLKLSNGEIFVTTQRTHTGLMGALKCLNPLLKLTQLPLLRKNQGELLTLIQGAKSANLICCGAPLLHLKVSAFYMEEQNATVFL